MHTPRYHYLFDISAIREELFSSSVLTRILRALTDVVEMHVLAGPLIAEGHPDNPGLTGIVVVDYSHISIHTFAMHNEALIDIFSCKPYDRDKVRKYLHENCCTKESTIREQEIRWDTA